MLPESGEYTVGNVFFSGKEDSAQRQASQSVFFDIANSLGLRVLGWRQVPTDGSKLGPAAFVRATAPPLRIVTSTQNISNASSMSCESIQPIPCWSLSNVCSHEPCSTPLFVYKVPLLKAFIFVRYRRRILCIRGSYLRPKYTIIITISIMRCIART